MQELQFQVLVLDPKVERRLQGAVVALGDFEAPDGVVFPKSAILDFYRDLILGRPFPLTLVINSIDGIGSLVALSVFLHRDLALHPGTLNLVSAATLVDQLQVAGLAHVDRDLARFFRLLTQFFPPNLGRKEQEIRLTTAVGWIRQYILDGTLPALPHEPAVPRILTKGTNGFVVAETPSWKSMEEGWVELYRQGFLRGVLFGTARDGKMAVLAARKSPFLLFDLAKAARFFNEAEQAMGELPEWQANDLWLKAPGGGTLLLATQILDVLVRV